jgi:hypothetical protein
MSGDYLWDKSGEPDSELAHLEEVLGRLGGPAPPMGEIIVHPRRAIFRRPWLLGFASAALAMIALAVSVVWRVSRLDWMVIPVAGVPRLGSVEMTGNARLRVGELVETDEHSRAEISVGRVASLEMEPNTSLKLTQSGLSGHRVSLEHGKLRAVIWARPKLFFVDTPSAVAVDLGCAYSLEVDAEGNTVVHVSHGLVSIESHGHNSYILAGAVCVARKGLGLGTPYYTDASPALIQALNEFDLHGQAEALATVLSEARPKDALTLWHLIPKFSGPLRAAIIGRLAAFVPPPPSVTAEGLSQGNSEMLDRWWNAVRMRPVPNSVASSSGSTTGREVQ